MKKRNWILEKLNNWLNRINTVHAPRQRLLLFLFLTALAGAYCIYLMGQSLSNETGIFYGVRPISIPSYFSKSGIPDSSYVQDMKNYSTSNRNFDELSNK